MTMTPQPGTAGKYIFKRAIEGYLPKQIIYRQKMGFGIPMSDWFRNGIRDFARTQLLDVQEPYLSNQLLQRSGTSVRAPRSFLATLEYFDVSAVVRPATQE